MAEKDRIGKGMRLLWGGGGVGYVGVNSALLLGAYTLQA